MELKDFNDALSIILMAMAFLLFLIVAARTRMHLDILAIIVSIGFLASFFLRLPFLNTYLGMNYFTAGAFFIVWGCMYYFVFEMKRLEDVLKSESPVEYQKRSAFT